MPGKGWRRRFDDLVRVDKKDWAVLKPLLLVGSFESYDSSLLSIGASTLSVGLGVSASAFAIAAAFIRLAGLSATFVVREADRIGFDGLDERFRRLWRYYLAYCEGGFRAGSIDVMQVALTRD